MRLSGIASTVAVPLIYGGLCATFGAGAGWIGRQAFQLNTPIASAALAAGVANGALAATYMVASRINDMSKLKLQNKHLGLIAFAGFVGGVLAAPSFVPNIDKISSAAFSIIGAGCTIGIFSLVK